MDVTEAERAAFQAALEKTKSRDDAIAMMANTGYMDARTGRDMINAWWTVSRCAAARAREAIEDNPFYRDVRDRETLRVAAVRAMADLHHLTAVMDWDVNETSEGPDIDALDIYIDERGEM